MDEDPTAVFEALVIPLLTIVAVVLKLTGVITWSWWWVLSPLWIPVVLVLLAVLAVSLAGAE